MRRRERDEGRRFGVAVVLGAGIGGILAASVLARHYAEVILVDRDRIGERPVERRGVPQGKHPHILLRRGEEAIRRLLPGALDRLRPRDLTPMDIGRELRWFHAGVWKARHDPGFRFHTCEGPTGMRRCPNCHAAVTAACPNRRCSDG